MLAITTLSVIAAEGGGGGGDPQSPGHVFGSSPVSQMPLPQTGPGGGGGTAGGGGGGEELPQSAGHVAVVSDPSQMPFVLHVGPLPPE